MFAFVFEFSELRKSSLPFKITLFSEENVQESCVRVVLSRK